MVEVRRTPKQARSTIRKNEGNLVFVIEKSGKSFFGKIDARDAEDRSGAYTLITPPQNLMTRHNYKDIKEIYSIGPSCQLF